MLVSAGRAKDPAAVERAFAAAFSGYEVRGTAEPADWIREAVVSGAAECAFFIESADAYIYYVNDLSMYDTNTAVADEVLQNLYRVEAMIDGGIGAGEAERILSTQITHTITNLGRDQMQNFLHVYFDFCAVYGYLALWTDGCNQCGDRKEFQGNGTFDYQCKAGQHDVWQGGRFLFGRSVPACGHFRLGVSVV